ncbi:MAG: metallophosphoesterase family protein [Acidobacteria bacterium]|nr:metallophosphoesterase family protein [Acidobacteriota bacterium]
MRVGVLADTHGVLRPAVLERLAGCDLLLHGGDIGEPGGGEEPILTRLARLAPVLAVRGNCDGGELAAALPAALAGELAGLPYRMTHRREDVAPAWLRDSRLVVFGHSHRPELEWRGECLLLNPGGCGSRRFRLPLTVAVVRVEADRLIPEILAIE